MSVLRGLLGSQINMNPNLQPATVAYWVGNDESETLPVTVTFGTPQTLNQLQTINRLTARPYGIVQFGSRDMLLQAEVDIGRGTQFTVHGSSVTLQVAMDKATGVNTGYRKSTARRHAFLLSDATNRAGHSHSLH